MSVLLKIESVNRLKAFFASLDRRIGDLVAGAIEADLRDAGYAVTRRQDGTISWAEPQAGTGR